MTRERKRSLWIAGGLLAAFGLWTLAVTVIDVQPIGPENSAVGFAAVNGWVHSLTGVNWVLYTVTDWLSLVPLGMVMSFGILGLCQWIRRGSIRRVDRSLLALGGFYVAVMAMFVFFEFAVVNCRPVLIDGVLEASYPSSTTMLVLCVMPTGMMQLRERKIGGRWVRILLAAFTAFVVIARLVSGVHWFTDIIGGGLLSAGLVALYDAIR